MTRADIESIEKQDIQCRYVGKQAPQANRKKLTAIVAMDDKGLMKLEGEQLEEEAGGMARGAANGKKAKRRQTNLQNREHIPPSASLDSAYHSQVCKGQREDPIQIDDLETDKEWEDTEIEVYNQPLQHRLTPMGSDAEALHQAVPLTTGRTLGMTLRPRRGGGDGRGGNDCSGCG